VRSAKRSVKQSNAAANAEPKNKEQRPDVFELLQARDYTGALTLFEFQVC